MIETTIGEIESKIRAAAVSDSAKNELLQLLASLRSQVAALDTAHHAVREKHQLIKHSVEELRSSVEGFEGSHPKLVQAVNSISNTLANLGI